MKIIDPMFLRLGVSTFTMLASRADIVAPAKQWRRGLSLQTSWGELRVQFQSQGPAVY